MSAATATVMIGQRAWQRAARREGPMGSPRPDADGTYLALGSQESSVGCLLVAEVGARPDTESRVLRPALGGGGTAKATDWPG